MPRHEVEVLERGTATPISATVVHRTGIHTPEGLEYVAVAMGGTNEPPPPPAAPPSGGGDGGMTAHLRLRLVEIGLGALAAASGLGFWFVMDRMDSRFDRLQAPLMEVQKTVAGQDKSISAIERSLSRIEDRLDTRNDNQPQTGPGPGEAGAVRPGAGGGAKPDG